MGDHSWRSQTFNMKAKNALIGIGVVLIPIVVVGLALLIAFFVGVEELIAYVILVNIFWLWPHFRGREEDVARTADD